ncbi:MAG TPA: pyridoxamine 5'-phosphate oxidase family protein [Burkholderiales bacterium]|jgi:predicted pyridoxine 5'-phosphate oxidase superfamily flavin-nucleotide-binding protein|nr:pyridoxamine 5'-phosphate oxidase family protein [Burkholderiales bacterium]
MTHRFAEIAFTDAVKSAQARYGARAQNERLEARAGPNAALTDRESAFIAARDSFYLATVSETGWPYVQHRGGPQGFLKVIDARTLAFADFGGNRQFVSVGNAATDDRVSLILMDYAQRLRLKMLGRMRMFDLGDAPPELVFEVELPDYRARIERVAVIAVEAFDWNCPQHITPRFTEAEVRAAAQPLHDRIAALEAELARLRAG